MPGKYLVCYSGGTRTQKIYEIGAEGDLSFNRDKYSLYHFSFDKEIYISETGMDKDYTTLKKMDIEALIVWLESLGFKKK